MFLSHISLYLSIPLSIYRPIYLYLYLYLYFSLCKINEHILKWGLQHRKYVACHDHICTVLVEVPIANATIAVPIKKVNKHKQTAEA